MPLTFIPISGALGFNTRFARKKRGFTVYKLASNWKSGSDDGDFQKGRKIMHGLLRQASIPMRQVQ